MAGVKRLYLGAVGESNKPRSAEMAVANPTAAGESKEVDLSAKLATREVASMKNTSHLADLDLVRAVGPCPNP